MADAVYSAGLEDKNKGRYAWARAHLPFCGLIQIPTVFCPGTVFW